VVFLFIAFVNCPSFFLTELLLKPQGPFLFFNSKKKEAKNAAAYGKKLKIKGIF